MTAPPCDRSPWDRHMAEAVAGIPRRQFRVLPNPPVVALVIRDGEVVGAGEHGRYGGDHAEAAALRSAAGRTRGATLVVTLEPCAHRGKKTPPCTQAILAAGIARVVYAAPDVNPLTSGLGPDLLREAGVEVVAGIRGAEARAAIRRYEDHLREDLPWTVSKWAMTLDGKISDVGRGPVRISGEAASSLVHDVRGSVDAVAVGVGTVLADDPLLVSREASPPRRAVRVVLDTRLRTPPASRVVRTAREHGTWIACGEGAPAESEGLLEAHGCRVLRVPEVEGRVDLVALFRVLRREGLRRILLEGGETVHAAAFAAGVSRQVMAFVAPSLLGGQRAPTPVGGAGLAVDGLPWRLEEARVEALGEDALLEGFVPVGAVRPAPRR